jgi:predicted porin
LTRRIASYSSFLAAAALCGSLSLAQSARAEITLVQKDKWTVYMNGRVQTFFSYANGDGFPRNVTDANCQPITTTDANGNMVTDQLCNPVELRQGGLDSGAALPEFPAGTDLQTSDEPGKVEELRIRTGFTGNVLGFGIKNQVNETTEIGAYTAVTVGIDSDERRKFSIVRPDWRESYLRVSAPWGSLTAGRQLTLFSRGATEITYLYGYRYGLGFPGGVTPASQSTAGHIGFGVLANGFGAGFMYATPDMAGLQLSVGIFDANNIVGTQLLERTRWPRPEAELTYETKFSGGMFKLFGNGAFQKVYDYQGTPRSASIWGAGAGGRLEIGPVHLGVAGHYGKGVGVDYSLQPNNSLYFVEEAQADPEAKKIPKLRNVMGYYAHLMVTLSEMLDVNAGFGVTRILQLPEDKKAWTDPNMGMYPIPSVGYVVLNQQVGIGGGLTVHATDSLHVTAEFFHANFEWYKPVPSLPSTKTPSQAYNFVNAGLTFEF